MRTLIPLLLTCLGIRGAWAQEANSSATIKSVLAGRIVTPAGEPISDATVRLLLSADSAVSDPRGRFVLRTGAVGTHRLVVRRLAFVPESLTVVLPLDGELTVKLRPSPRALETVHVIAGTYRGGYDKQATLTPIQVVNVPGAAGDIGRAIQSLPGVQTIDEGNGVYVRGGEAGETRVVLNDAVMLIALSCLLPRREVDLRGPPPRCFGIPCPRRSLESPRGTPRAASRRARRMGPWLLTS